MDGENKRREREGVLKMKERVRDGREGEEKKVKYIS